jgi:hypothetical protein
LSISVTKEFTCASLFKLQAENAAADIINKINKVFLIFFLLYFFWNKATGDANRFAFLRLA